MAGRASLGSLVVSLGLDAATFTSGLSKADYQAKQFADKLAKGVAQGAAAAVTALGALATAAGGYLAAVDAIADSVAGFQDLADKMGDTAEQVASLQLAADLSETSLETVVAASVRLTTQLSKVSDETKGAGAALRAIGLDVDAFRRLDPAAQMEAVAAALDTFEDSAGKTAVAVALFGKAGADIIPFLKDLAEEGGRNVRITELQIKAADDYVKQKARLTSQFQTFVQVVSLSALPTLLDLGKALVDTANRTIDLEEDAARLNASNAVADWADKAVRALAFVLDAGGGVGRIFEAIGKTIGAAAAQFAQFAQGNFAGANAVGQAWLEDMKRLAEAPLLGQQITNAYEAAARARRSLAAEFNDRRFSGGRDQLNFTVPDTGGAKKDPDAEAKSYLENLQRAQNKLQELTVTQTLLADIESKRLAVTNPGLRDQLMVAATLNDLANDQIEAERRLAEAEKERKRQAVELEREIAQVRELGIGPIERTAREVERINELLMMEKITAEEAAAATQAAWSKVLAATEERVKKTNEFAIQAARNMQTILGDAIGDAILGKFEEGVQGMLRRWAEVLARMAAQAAAAKLLQTVLGAAGSGGGGWGAVFNAIFSTEGRAGGGPVAPGTTYVVGERGPERLTMGTAGGYITPNSQMGAVGKQEIAVNTTVHVDASGTQTTRSGADASARALATTVEQLTRAAIAREMQQGGVIWRQRMGYA